MAVATAQDRNLKRPGDESVFVYEGTRFVANFILLAGLMLVSNRANTPR